MNLYALLKDVCVGGKHTHRDEICLGLVFKQVSWNSELHLLGTGQEDSSNDGGLVIVDDAHTIFPPGTALATSMF